MQLSLKDIYLEVCTQALSTQRKDGSMPAGHNGPYRDPETPVRNTSHWGIAFGKAYDISQNEAFLSASKRCFDYLLNNREFRAAHTFVHRNKAGKDSCNGLIGPAWNIEALLEAWCRFSEAAYLELALRLFDLHPFDRRSALWHRVDPDGRTLSVDGTLNHQLWFYAVSLGLAEHISQVSKQAQSIFEYRLDDHLAVATNGRIRHPIWSNFRLLKEVLRALAKPKQSRAMRIKEVGYHCFNLYALGIVEQNKASVLAALQGKLQQALAYLSSPEFAELLPLSPYSYAYNPPGFELPVIAELFQLAPEAREFANQALQDQIRLTYNRKMRDFSLDNPDPQTLTARIYELARLPNWFFDQKLVVGGSDFISALAENT